MSTHQLWLDPRFSPRFVATRAVLLFSAALPIYWSLASVGYGLIALAVLLAAAWPYRYRISLGDAELEIRWLFLCERIPLASISQVRVGPDPRRCVLGPRDAVLRVGRRERAPFLIFGERAELSRMAIALQSSVRVDPPSGA